MSVLKGDFIGFKYNGIHSSDLGIVRTSNGSRFDENLLPTIQDKTVQVPGGDGTYYFGSYYTQRQFNIPFAFDSLSESQIEFLKIHFGDKKVHPLVFDEAPYKVYMAKVTGTATIKYIPFDGAGINNRIYKGEGTIQFTCYSPYAICENKYLSNYPNNGQWKIASGLLAEQGEYDSFSNGQIKVYNPGAKGADWILTINPVDGKLPSGKISLGEHSLVFGGGDIRQSLGFSDNLVTFNSKTGLVEGWQINGDKKTKSSNIYNDYITAGEFFQIPVTGIRGPKGFVMDENPTYFRLSDDLGKDGAFVSLKYDYYYL